MFPERRPARLFAGMQERRYRQLPHVGICGWLSFDRRTSLRTACAKSRMFIRTIMKLRSLAIIFSTLGILISGYAYYQHLSPVESSFCNISDTFSCDIVNKGPWSEIQNIPVSLIGIIGYAFLLSLAVFKPAAWKRWFLFGSLFGFSFSLYLTYLEWRVIFAWCIICISSLFIITALLLMSLFWVFKKSSDNKRSGAAG